MESIEIATKLYEWMSRDLDSPEGTWVVDPHYFLPANVLCDISGKAAFIRNMATIIDKNRNK